MVLDFKIYPLYMVAGSSCFYLTCTISLRWSEHLSQFSYVSIIHLFVSWTSGMVHFNCLLSQYPIIEY
uniref:Uncharacterized protein n=1 Tax=Setaria italica TaxID=4555 RepID=K3ZPK5_SETIT